MFDTGQISLERNIPVTRCYRVNRRQELVQPAILGTELQTTKGVRFIPSLLLQAARELEKNVNRENTKEKITYPLTGSQ